MQTYVISLPVTLPNETHISQGSIVIGGAPQSGTEKTALKLVEAVRLVADVIDQLSDKRDAFEKNGRLVDERGALVEAGGNIKVNSPEVKDPALTHVDSSYSPPAPKSYSE